MDNGTLLNELTLGSAPEAERTSDEWLNFISQTKAPNSNYYLPYIQTQIGDILSTDDGALRIYRQRDERVFIETDGIEQELLIEGGEQLISMDLDGALGTFVALDETLKLHIYQQNIRIGTFDIGLKQSEDLRPVVTVSRGGSAIYATDGRRIVYVNSAGVIQKTLETHYYIGQLSASPSGAMVITSDMESGVLRVYKGDKLVLTHQKFAIDLLADANQVQLLADLPPVGTAISTITAHSKGILAFALSGVVCVTHVKHMDEVPRPKKLL
ncbi:MAG: hypothetical protein Phog2KO_48650 [Phototrophicaceae bacterium]